MKKQLIPDFLPLFCLCLFLHTGLFVFAQDCSNNRYLQQSFPFAESFLNVKYGSNVQQDGTTPIDLHVDIYAPQSDTHTDRPLIILAHGGSFISGNKSDIALLCQETAKKGYVVASMQYRLLDIADPAVFLNPGLEFQKEAIRAVHDMRALIRFFRKSVAESNPYGIDSNLIIVGGFSAGAIVASHTAYLDTEAKLPAELVSYVAEQGGIEGNSGNAGYGSKPQLVVSYCGGIVDTTWIGANAQPLVGVHNVDDPVVPNVSGQPNIGVVIPVTIYGDSSIYVRMQNLGIESAYKSVPGASHCDFLPEHDAFVIDFIHEQICEKGTLSISDASQEIAISLYPNPTSTYLTIELPSNQSSWTLSFNNMLGQQVFSRTLSAGESTLSIDVSALPSGFYSCQLIAESGKMINTKVLIE